MTSTKFPTSASVLSTYIECGWNYEDVWTLCKNSTNWRDKQKGVD